MKKDICYHRKNLERASDLIARKYRVRDQYLLGQPYYLDLLNYITDVLRLTLPSKARILEVSCGTGILAEMLLKELPGIVLDASDVSAETLEVVRKERNGLETGFISLKRTIPLIRLQVNTTRFAPPMQ